MVPTIAETHLRATRREDAVTMALAGWTIVGLFVDAYYHVTDPTLESFWTPWHALFYSGFLATVAWMLLTAFRHRSPGAGLLEALPLGYRATALGVVLFAVGGIGDALWHTAFGVEQSIDALLSPTHILLWLGLLAVASTPLRAAWRDASGSDDAGPASFAPVLASLVIVVTLVAFFFEYAWVLADDGFARSFFDTSDDSGQIIAAYGVMGIIISTVILMTPIILANDRWHLPFGTMTAVFAIPNVLIAVGFDEDAVGIIPAIAAGVVGDILIRARTHRLLVATAPPAVLWSLYFLGTARVGPITWPPAVWGGAIFFAVLSSVVLSLGVRIAGPLSVGLRQESTT